jgi:hypothetical protein
MEAWDWESLREIWMINMMELWNRLVHHFTHLLSAFLELCRKIKFGILKLYWQVEIKCRNNSLKYKPRWKEKFTSTFGQNHTCMWSTSIYTMSSEKLLHQSIWISLGLKIQFELLRLNLFKLNFVHPFNSWLGPLPPNIQFFYRFYQIRIGSENSIHPYFSR